MELLKEIDSWEPLESGDVFIRVEQENSSPTYYRVMDSNWLYVLQHALQLYFTSEDKTTITLVRYISPLTQYTVKKVTLE